MPTDQQLLDSKTKLTEALQSAVASLQSVTVQPVPDDGGWATRLQDFAADWGGLLGLFFMAAIVYVLWRTLKMMPRTKPVQIKPQAKLKVGWDEIAGADEAKAELMEVVDFLRDPKRFKKLGATVPKGVLLHGPPGTGKTLLAKAVAHESGAQFFAQSASSFVEMFAGLGAARIRRLFDEARKNAPAILFIDEIDAVGARRGSDNNSEREQTLNQLLVEMDGFESTGDLVVMAASNLLEKLDPALLRPGRFDRQVFVSPPDVEGRYRILEVHTRDKPLAADVDLRTVAAQTSGLTGADLANLANEAAIFCARRGAEALTMADFDGALERVVAGVQTNTTLNEHERRVVAFHEAGHALCRELLVTTDRVHKISIVPRGTALGYVMNLPDEDSYLKTREELVDQMTVLLGGRVAEQIVFGAVTNGAANDLQRVAEITHAMVHEYGMGTTASGSASRAVTDANIVSDMTRRIRDEEQQALAYEAERAAYALIEQHRPKLDEFAHALLEREVLVRDDIDEIMRGVPRIERRPGATGLRIAAVESPGAP
ncbi:ATP-dependent zinc metalloprotease FtsH [Conexibacter sp. W3-3-2]|uniref:ATP-dependent metallopeptidase FtsH/Yme1/Tma family protein n=1 Tax=Conexibacter sp. W3-3-2 TaxID=2675227 RepID=UPI0012B86305|nr:AAA family ATPase [Conexibacter sp. W3-3-2]MTD45679.1 ATP-dependent zinc metalloprotease FtsH [Conexibacter sp. W3-3-2]